MRPTTPRSHPSLARSAALGTGWATLAQMVRLTGTIAVQLVLVRLLSPAEMGVTAQALVFTAFVAVIAELGLEAALLQPRDLSPAEINGAAAAALAVSLLLVVLTLLAAPAIADFFDEPELIGLVRIATIAFPAIALGAISRGLLGRGLRFQAIALADIGGFTAGAIAAIAAAMAGAGSASVVLQVVVASVACTALLWTASRWRPTLDRAWAPWLGRAAAQLVAANSLSYWSRSADNVVVGRALGASALGVYSRAYVIMLFPVTQLSWVIGRVMVPTLSRLQPDLGRVRWAYRRTLRVIATVTFPAMAGLAALAHPFVEVVLGEDWLSLVPVLRILCIVGAAHSIFTTVGWIYQTCARTDLLLAWSIAATAITVAGFIVGAHVGTIEAVAWSYVITNVAILGYPVLRVPFRLIGLPVKQVVRDLVPAVMVASVAGAVTSTTSRLLEGRGPVAQLLGSTLIGCLAVIGTIRAAGLPALTDVVELLRQRTTDLERTQ